MAHTLALPKSGAWGSHDPLMAGGLRLRYGKNTPVFPSGLFALVVDGLWEGQGHQGR